MKYEYEILNYWNDSDDLYVNYLVLNKETNEKANCIEYYNTSDIGCDYNTSTESRIEECLNLLLVEHDGLEFKYPKVSEISPLLKYVYDCVCESESNMCHVDYNDWEELKEDYDFLEEDIITLKNEVKKYNLDDLITIDDNEYKIVGYGCLQTMFNDDRERTDELER